MALMALLLLLCGGEYLRDVFEDDEIEGDYTDGGGDATYAAVRVSGAA
ncbi:hypothetical protein PF005_g3059 [Phytophthora fragariae]|uniref:Uncharacterized protein n=1 Tax=Phytophthora fragariae TaxID=53985 RepID=A0A6A3FPZ7_9STRA|nr:hypothetical protein PF003_g35690 [Phytophthora fragariae]KAE8947083.1 hypothetical protein PF009_g3307 [Phytophthora fragariae]KAE9026568.1 hypothetical protein PF011_g2486 [Phytophthora fragariae]KAE9133724.1 hypothetical protein PF010_g2706 [Phytophthora fragariae]KAE9134393.1 hypothetical protein PF007_g2960 [Phytophthora fragariae]